MANLNGEILAPLIIVAISIIWLWMHQGNKNDKDDTNYFSL